MSKVVLARSQALTLSAAMTQLGSTVFPAAEVQVSISGTGAPLTGAELVIVGKDENGAAQTENLPIASVGDHTSTGLWSAVESMTPTGIADFSGYSAQVIFEDPYAETNGDADDVAYETMQELRFRLLRRLGYAAHVASPPPGMADLLNDFLISAHRYWFKRVSERRQTRYFTWVMTPGERFFTISGNQDLNGARLDPNQIEWAGLSDQNQTWLPLAYGIPPELYTLVTQPGLPGRYEVHQNIEVMPAPDRPYRLRIKGTQRMGTFSSDNDTTSIDSELVFLWALANAKNHYGHPDADAVAAQANGYFGSMVAETHGTRRYIPGTCPQIPLTKPRFLPLG